MGSAWNQDAFDAEFLGDFGIVEGVADEDKAEDKALGGRVGGLQIFEQTARTRPVVVEWTS